VQRDDPHPDEDAAWRDIVDNYGERAELDPDDELPERAVAAPEQPIGLAHVFGADSADADDDADEDDEDDDPTGPSSYRPEPEAIPVPPFDRLLAWIGVFGSPTLLLIFLVLGLSMPGWLGWLLVGGFVGGFVYLVMRMPGTPRDPWDDGARL
jgi:hypothetical protein